MHIKFQKIIDEEPVWMYMKMHLTSSLVSVYSYSLCVLVTQPCLIYYDFMDCSPPGSYVYGIFQARILEWVAISFSRGSSQHRDRTWSPVLQTDSLSSELLNFWVIEKNYNRNKIILRTKL